LINNFGVESRRVAVLGLDGTPYSFLKSEIEAGTLPHLGSLFSHGEFRQMETELPAISSVAWASFMTGVNPGEHGIYGFTDRKPGTYDITFPNYADLKAEPVWDRISRVGGRCCVLNVPSTYPARPLNGVLVSGFVAPTLQRAVYPPEAFDYLNRSGYRIDVDASLAQHSLDLFIDDLHATLEKRREAILHFLGQENWDFFMAVFTGTDRLHHFLWRFYVEGDAVYRPEFLRYYRRLDEIIGEIFSLLPADTARFMLSDHGFCGIEKEVFLNPLLAQAGLLALKGGDPKTIADMDAGSTRAYCMDPGRIYLNLRGREPGGIVAPAAAEGILDEITALLMGLRDPENGGQVIERVARGKEIFSGPRAEAGPDLVAVPRPGYDLKGRMAGEIFARPQLLSGMHTYNDAFVFVDSVAGSAAPAHIRGLAPLIEKTWGGVA